MLSFQALNLGNDGLTKCCELDGYEGRELHREGWTLVGLAEAQTTDGANTTTKLFGVYRLTETEALRKTIEDAAKSAKDRGEAVRAKEEAERKLKDTLATLSGQVQLATEATARAQAADRVVAMARERFGAAFGDLEREAQ